ncbi:MAG: hypothetical protein HXX80_00075 [Nitrososphaerales archaeon]|nr:hypothetical protein [Nitrososphaerales archaeon]
MGRISILIGLGLVGYALGFIGFLAFSVLAEALVNFLPFLLNIDSYLMRAALSGVVGSIITLVAIVVWSYSSKRY